MATLKEFLSGKPHRYNGLDGKAYTAQFKRDLDRHGALSGVVVKNDSGKTVGKRFMTRREADTWYASLKTKGWKKAVEMKSKPKSKPKRKPVAGVYTATHTNQKAIANHIRKIKARGGKVQLQQVNRGVEVRYSFPAKAK